MIGTLLKVAKFVGKATGVTVDAGSEVPTTSTRKIRLAVTAVVAALLVWVGVDPDVATALGDLLTALVAAE